MGIVINKNKTAQGEGTIVLHDTANASYVVAGNNSVSNLSSAGFIVESAAVSRIWYGSEPAAYWTVSRGSNTIAVLSGSGYEYFDGAALGMDGNANLVFTLTGGTVGYIMTEIKIKQRVE